MKPTVAFLAALLPYRTSWLGNSLAGSERGIQQQVQGLAVEPVSGRIYLNAHGDEGDKYGGIYSPDGDQISRTENSKLSRRSGYAIGATAEFVFRACQDEGKEKTGGKRRFFISKNDAFGHALAIPDADALKHLRLTGTSGHVRGLAASTSRREVYASHTDANEVLVFDFDLKLLRRFPVPKPGSIALAKNGDLWLIERDEPALCRYTADGDGQMDAGEFRAIEDGEKMRDIFVDDSGGLWLTTKADDGRFFHLPCAGLDTHGIPRHDWAAKQRFTPPAGFAEAGRLFYECATDTLHIGGFATAQPRKGSEFKQFGNEVRSYAGWLRGDRREAGKVTLP